MPESLTCSDTISVSYEHRRHGLDVSHAFSMADRMEIATVSPASEARNIICIRRNAGNIFSRVENCNLKPNQRRSQNIWWKTTDMLSIKLIKNRNRFLAISKALYDDCTGNVYDRMSHRSAYDMVQYKLDAILMSHRSRPTVYCNTVEIHCQLTLEERRKVSVLDLDIFCWIFTNFRTRWS